MSIKNGKLYGSKASAYQVLVRGREPIRWNSQGNPVEFCKPLTAEFAHHGGEVALLDPEDPTRVVDRFADIRGHFFDSAQQAEDKGWTQEEHDEVVEALDIACRTHAGDVWVVERAKAPKPWPKYDEAHHNQIPVLAEQLGLVAEALAYEAENKNRVAVTAKLAELLDAAQEVASEDAEIVAA